MVFVVSLTHLLSGTQIPHLALSMLMIPITWRFAIMKDSTFLPPQEWMLGTRLKPQPNATAADLSTLLQPCSAAH